MKINNMIIKQKEEKMYDRDRRYATASQKE